MEGEAYSGKLDLTEHGDVYEALWEIDGSEIPGMGIRIENVLVLGYGQGSIVGVAVYDITSSRIDGEWTATSYSGLAEKTALPLGTEKGRK